VCRSPEGGLTPEPDGERDPSYTRRSGSFGVWIVDKEYGAGDKFVTQRSISILTNRRSPRPDRHATRDEE
jgi:hypothetical protein